MDCAPPLVQTDSGEVCGRGDCLVPVGEGRGFGSGGAAPEVLFAPASRFRPGPSQSGGRRLRPPPMPKSSTPLRRSVTKTALPPPRGARRHPIAILRRLERAEPAEQAMPRDPGALFPEERTSAARAPRKSRGARHVPFSSSRQRSQIAPRARSLPRWSSIQGHATRRCSTRACEEQAQSSFLPPLCGVCPARVTVFEMHKPRHDMVLTG